VPRKLRIGAGGPTTLPLLTASDYAYLGAFKLPSGYFGGGGFAYGGRALTFYQDPTYGATLYIGAGIDGEQIAQIDVPADVDIKADASGATLATCTVLQNFEDIADGTLVYPTFDADTNDKFVYGLIPYNGRLIVGAATYYASGAPTNGAIGAFSSMNLSSGSFGGWKYLSGAGVISNRRSQGGMACLVPSAWQSLIGGPALMGNATGPLSVVANSSFGFSLNVFDPDDVGASASIPGKTLAFFDGTGTRFMSGVSNGDTTQSDIWNLSTWVGGYFFAPGTRTLGVVTATGAGPYDYGVPTGSLTITGISTAGGYVTVTFTPDYAYSPGNGTRLYFQAVGGMTQINHGATPSAPTVQFYYAANVTGSTFRIATNSAGTLLSTAGLSAWTSGGKVHIYDGADLGGIGEIVCHNDYNLGGSRGPQGAIPEFGYRYQVLMYDATHLAQVNAGTRDPWDLTPYEVYILPDTRVNNPTATIDGMPRCGRAIYGVAYDPTTARLYLCEEFGGGSEPRVEVFQLTNRS